MSRSKPKDLCPQYRGELQSNARAFRARLEAMVAQIDQDPKATALAGFMPLIGMAMASMDDATMLELRDFLRALVGD